MATVVGEGLAYKPPVPPGPHHHSNPVSSISSSSGQPVTTTSCDIPATTVGISLTPDTSLKRKKTDYNFVATSISITDVTSTPRSNPPNGHCSMTRSNEPVGLQSSLTDSAKRVCIRDEQHSQPEVLDLTVTMMGNNTIGGSGCSGDTGHVRSSTCEEVTNTSSITVSTQSLPPTSNCSIGGTFTLFPPSCSTSSLNGYDPSNSIPSGLYQLPPTHPTCFVAPQMLQDAACLIQQQPHLLQQAPTTMELQQSMVSTLGMFGTNAFAAPFPMTPGTTPSSLMGGGTMPPITSVPFGSAGNTIYGNPFPTGLFPSNPFQWTTPPQLTLPTPLTTTPTVPSLNTTTTGPNTNDVNQSNPFSLTTWNPSLLMPPLSDPSILMMNGCLPNGTALPDEVKPDLMVQDLLAWSQAVAQFHQQQQQPQQNSQIISDGTRQLSIGNTGSNQGNTSETSEGLTTSPRDDLNQSDLFDGQGESSALKFTNPIRKYGSFEECGSAKCQSTGVHEHYHCQSCEKVIIRREEMIRHAKWHRKREESLQYGFMRYSPGDNCAVAGCAHNGRQTHYHCLQSNCTKVYISTSDVQMHANFHRKDAVIIQEGFQRFRASENCGAQTCPFYQERTTHFHCRRPNCRFTFKNKADMEKHKLHHQKNDNFAKDGFRKYIKCETCGFPSCKYSGIINHIHCIRPGCDYVVHSSSQILSHKRKHDRRFSHLTSDSSPNNPQLLSDLSNLTFDFALPQLSGPAGGPRSRSTYSPYDLSPTADFDEPLDMKCSTLSGPVPKPSNDEDVLSTPPTTSGENSPATRDLSSPLQTDNHRNEKRRNDCSGESDGLLDQATCLLARCLRTQALWKSKPADDGDQSLLSFGIERPNLCLLFDQLLATVNKLKDDDDDDDEGWHIEGEQNPDSADEELQSVTQDVSDSEVVRILKLIKCFYQAEVRSSDIPSGADARPFRCNWPQCPSNEKRDAHHASSGSDGADNVEDNIDRDVDDDFPQEKEGRTNLCPYEIQHIWHMAVLQRGLLNCSATDTQCPIDQSDKSHRHCCFWPTCQYITRTDEPNWVEPFNHLSGHDNRLINVPSGSECLQTGDGDDDLDEDCSETPMKRTFLHNSKMRVESLPTTTGDAVITPNETLLSHQPRRRGRPPKYTKYVRVPRLHVPDELCTDDLTVRELTRSMFFTESSGPSEQKEDEFAHIVCGVKLYLTNEKCPDTLCDYSIQRVEHYHCVRPRCFMASESLDLINVHRREFHSHIRISPGFEHFDRSVDCRRPTCHSKRMSQHYHCTYPNCDYAFIRPSTMIPHARKHEEVARARRLGLSQHSLQNLHYHLGANKLYTRQAVIQHNHSQQHHLACMRDTKPPFLPLGLSPLVAAHLPSIFPGASNTPGATTELPVDCSAKSTSIDFSTINSTTIAAQQQQQQQTSLPGFLPIWAAAMAAAAAAVAKQTNGWPSSGSFDSKPELPLDRGCLVNQENSTGAITAVDGSGTMVTKSELLEETRVGEV